MLQTIDAPADTPLIDEDGLFWTLAKMINQVYRTRGQPYDAAAIYQQITDHGNPGTIETTRRYVRTAMDELSWQARDAGRCYRNAFALSRAFSDEADGQRDDPLFNLRGLGKIIEENIALMTAKGEAEMSRALAAHKEFTHARRTKSQMEEICFLLHIAPTGKRAQTGLTPA